MAGSPRGDAIMALPLPATPSRPLPFAKYHQVYLVLREQLAEGRFAEGLPGELELVRQFGVGRVTVRRALEQLVNDGLIVRQAGRGTRPVAVVTASDPASGSATFPVARLGGLLGHIVQASRSTTVQVLDWRAIPAPASVAQALQLEPGARVRLGVRLRSASAGPVSLITTHVPEALARGIGRRELAQHPMLQLLQDAGVELGGARQTVTARAADAVTAARLQVPVGAALLSVTRVVCNTADRPVQLLQGLYRPDRYEYEMELSQVGGVDARVVARELLP
jgi:GntR family transcriptional regulator